MFVSSQLGGAHFKIVFWGTGDGPQRNLEHVHRTTGLGAVTRVAVDGGAQWMYHLVPPGLGTARGHQLHMHLYAPCADDVETASLGRSVLRGVDGIVFVALGTPGDQVALSALRARLRELSISFDHVPLVVEADRAASAVRAQLGLPEGATIEVDVDRGAGVFPAFKAVVTQVLKLAQQIPEWTVV